MGLIKKGVLIIFILFFFVSCSNIGLNKFSTKKEAEIYAINAMKEKYQIEFIITESVYESEMHKNLIGTMESIDGQFNDISFQVLNIGGLKDNLSKNYFETPLKLMIDTFIEIKPKRDVRVNYKITAETRAKLKKKSQYLGMSENEIINQLLDNFVSDLK